MTNEVKHTPLPWHIGKNAFRQPIIKAENGYVIAELKVDFSSCENSSEQNDALEGRAANTAFIVTACNSHYPMLEALEEVTHEVEAALRCVTNHETRAEMQTKATKARAAIRLAKGGV